MHNNSAKSKLEKRLQAVEGHPGTIIKQAPTFIQIPDTKANGKYFECIEIAKKYSDLQNIPYYNGRLFKFQSFYHVEIKNTHTIKT